MTEDDTKEKEQTAGQESVTLGEVMRDAQHLNERFIKSLDIMCAKGVEVDYLVDGKPVKGFPAKLRFAPLRYGDLAEMVQRRKADSLKLYRDHVYHSPALAKQRFQDLHVILMRLAMPEDFAFTDPGNVRNAVQLSLCRGHRVFGNDSWAPTLEQVDQLIEDEAFKAFVLDVIEIEMYGPKSTDLPGTQKGNDGAGNPTEKAGHADTTASETTPT